MNLSSLKNNVKKAVSAAVIRGLHASGQHKLLARLCAPYVLVVTPDGELVPVGEQKDRAQSSVLALDAERFRADLEIFAKHSDIRFLAISWGLLEKLLDAFVGRSDMPGRRDCTTANRRANFAKAPRGSKIYKNRVRYRKFLRLFLPHFYELLGIEAITSTDSRFRRQMDIGRISSQMGVPYICYYREGLYMVPALYKLAVERHQRLAPFHMDVMAVQNQVTREMLVASGTFREQDIVVRGCPRMDSFLNAISSNTAFPASRQISVFSSPSAVLYGENIRYDLLDTMKKAMRVIGRIAKAQPDVRIVVKIKDQHLKEGVLAHYQEAIREAVNEMPANIEFNTDRMAAHEVILNSTIICALQSTVVLEAAISGRPVILPHFREALEAPHAAEALMYSGVHHLFDVPESEKEMEYMLESRLAAPEISPDIMTGRRKLFEKYVSPLDASATRQGIELFKKHIALGRERRGAR